MIDALVTGAGGFIGQALSSRLVASGESVFMLGRGDGDVAEAATWQHLPPAGVVYHLAGRSYVPDSWTQGPDYVRANVVGTEQALAYCRRYGARLVLASAYVYGIPARLPVAETDPIVPNNPYAVTKRLAEQLCEFAGRYQGVSASVLRIFNVYGLGQREEFLIPAIVRQVRAGKEILLKDLAPRRDYVHLDDVVEAFVHAGRVESGFHVFNIGSGRSYSVKEIVDIIQSAAGTSLPVISSEVQRPQEIPDVVADISRAVQVLGWRPQLGLRDGMAQLLLRS